MGLDTFKNRRDAGARLAGLLDEYRDEDALILALPRGGVPVGYEVARRLGAPLDVFIVRKLGVPGQEELAMGAVASGGLRVFNQNVLDHLNLPPHTLARVIAHEEDEIERREKLYRGERPALDVKDRVVIVVDDGLATGSTMLAVVRTLRTHNPERVVIAVPVSPPETCDAMEREADDVVCLHRPEPFYGVGLWYDDFEQTTDGEVRELLDRAAVESGVAVGRVPQRVQDERPHV